MDEKAALQRQREAAAEAKIAAKKAGAGGSSRMAERPAVAPARADSSERPAGPPRLALAGNKPTWRERQAQKEAEAAAGNGNQSSLAAPPTDIATAEAELPRKTGYVPPGRRSDGLAPRGRTDAPPVSNTREQSAGGDSVPKWRPSAARGGSGRDGSPADGTAPRFVTPSRRGTEGLGGRDQSPADGPVKPLSRFQRDSGPTRSETPQARTESPVNTESRPGPGKFVPPHLRNRQ